MKKIIKLIFTIVILSTLVSCASNKMFMSTNETMTYEETGDSVATYDSNITIDENSKIIINCDLTIQTKEFDNTNNMLNELVNNYEGYIQTSSIYNYENRNDAYYTIRIPASSFNDFVNGTKEIGYVKSVNTSIDDVTDSYFDIEARISSLKAQKEKLDQMYSQCTTIDEIINVEQRLSEVQYEIDSYQATINNYDLLIKYSTINVSITEVKDITTPSNSFIDDIKNAFIDSYQVFINFVQNMIITLIYLLPFIIVLVIIILIIKKTRIISKINFRKKNKS